jgi:hypothetical protein
MRNLIPLFICGVIVLVSCKQFGLVAEMADLDRDHVSALLSTMEGDTEEATLAVKSYKLGWSNFKSRHKGLDKLRGWAEVSERIDALVERADRKVNSGEVRDAHADLRDIGLEFFKFRRQNDIEYFPDRLTEFREVMEPICDAAEDGELTPAELDFIDRTLPAALRLWGKAMSADFNRRDFGFSKGKESELKENLELEKRALDRLALSMLGGKRAAISNLIIKTRRHYEEISGMFGGDFSSLVNPSMD